MRSAFLLFAFVFSFFHSFSANIDQRIVKSAFLGKDAPVSVVLPDSYANTDSLPVIFLLHGYGGDNNNYIDKVKDLLSIVDTLDVVLVCVNGENAWYMDSPLKMESAYESYIIKELIPFISKNYKVLKSGSSRGIAGLSMGGFGSLYLSLKNLGVFGYVGSTSGGVDILPFPRSWGLSALLGESSDVKTWKNHSPYYMLDQVDVKQLKFKLVLDCGSEDFFFKVNNDFDAKLTELGVQHEYFVSKGAHDWIYWNKSIPVHLNKFCEAVKK
ncbi:MAG: alpha/beta hydrolase family protein [Bacteroidetes bacterium]|nr:alpha/beta hydrolase family protein [Bacteroidota bacterium]